MIWPWKKRRPQQPAHLRTGRWGEQQARRALAAKGYKLLGMRVRVGRRDEIDIVARKGEVLVFVEVKTRKNELFGTPASAVDRRKRDRLSRAAVRYLARLKQKPPYIRFDIVEVIGERGGASPEIRHIENAFTMNPKYRVRW